MDPNEKLHLSSEAVGKRHRWVMTCRNRRPYEIDIPVVNIEDIINTILKYLENLYLLTNVKEATFQHLYFQIVDIFVKIKGISEVNRISNIPQYEFKHYIMMMEHFWAVMCEYYAMKFWFHKSSAAASSADYMFRSVILDQEQNLEHVSVELIDSKDILRHIEHYYESCNYWRQLNSRPRFMIIETAKNMLVKLEAQSVTIKNMLINIDDEIQLEKHRLNSKLQLCKIAKFFIMTLMWAFLISFHYLTIYLNQIFDFHFPDIGSTLLCLLATTETISRTSSCWDRRNLNINLQILYLLLLWTVLAALAYFVYSYLTSFFELHTFALLEDYMNFRDKSKSLQEEYQIMRRYTIFAL